MRRWPNDWLTAAGVQSRASALAQWIVRLLLATPLALALTPCVAGAAEPSSAADPETVETYCATHPCRREARIRVRTEAGPIDTTLPYYWPAVRNDQVSILPGETLYVEAQRIGNRFISLKQVDTVVAPDRTLVFEFTQMEGDLDMMLKVDNPFDATLKYRVDMIDFRREPHPTSSCPIGARAAGFEHWPHAIAELVITNLHVLGDDEDTGCVY